MSWCKIKYIFITILFGCSTLYGQMNEIGIALGGVKPISDIGNQNILIPTSYSLGLTIKRHIGERYILRGDIYYHNLKDNDKNSEYTFIQNRAYSFDSHVIEISGGMDITFKKYNFLKQKNHILYLIGEVSAIIYSYKNPIISASNNIEFNTKKMFTFGIPLGIGYKLKINELILSLEYKNVFTFTNNLDGRAIDSNSVDSDAYNVNTYNKLDRYNFLTFNISYAFGRRPCFFCINKFDESKKKRK